MVIGQHEHIDRVLERAYRHISISYWRIAGVDGDRNQGHVREPALCVCYTVGVAIGAALPRYRRVANDA